MTSSKTANPKDPAFVLTPQFLHPCKRCNNNGWICAKNTKTKGNLDKCERCRAGRVKCMMPDGQFAKGNRSTAGKVYARPKDGITREWPYYYDEELASSTPPDSEIREYFFFFFFFFILTFFLPGIC